MSRSTHSIYISPRYNITSNHKMSLFYCNMNLFTTEDEMPKNIPNGWSVRSVSLFLCGLFRSWRRKKAIDILHVKLLKPISKWKSYATGGIYGVFRADEQWLRNGRVLDCGKCFGLRRKREGVGLHSNYISPGFTKFLYCYVIWIHFTNED